MMNKFTTALFCFLLWTAPTVQAGDESAPFGLNWLASSAEIEELGVNLVPMEVTTFGKSYVATRLPKGLSDLDTTILSFGYDDALWRVTAIGEENADDKYGNRGEARYDQLATTLAKSYKLEETFEHRPYDGFYSKAENFAYAISQNEAWWYRNFRSPKIDIELSLGSNHEDTYWRIIYSHRAAESTFDSIKADAELEAL